MSLRFSMAICCLWAFLTPLHPGLQAQDVAAASGLWNDSQIAQWASEQSPLARLYEAESRANLASIDRDDRSHCAQANLIQRVYNELACFERHEAAMRALKNAAQIRAFEQQRQLLADTLQTFDELILLTDKAERLELRDGNPLSVRRDRIAVEDQLEQVEAGISKSRILLAQQLNQPIADAERIPLEGEAPRLLHATRDDALQAAIAQRCDLQAIRQLCTSLNLDTLPAVRQAFAMLQPGLGLSVSTVARKALLASLHAPSPSNAELCRRREECQELQAMREQQVQVELFAAWVDIQSNQHRLRLAQKRVELSEQLHRQSLEAIKLDQGLPGSDLQALLEKQKAELQRIEQQKQLAASILEFYRIVGALPAQQACYDGSSNCASSP